jgi:hypothetical protein
METVIMTQATQPYSWAFFIEKDKGELVSALRSRSIYVAAHAAK